jgi:hypothetical protein
MVQVEPRELPEVALVVRKGAARCHPLQGVTEALHGATGATVEV